MHSNILKKWLPASHPVLGPLLVDKHVCMCKYICIFMCMCVPVCVCLAARTTPSSKYSVRLSFFSLLCVRDILSVYMYIYTCIYVCVRVYVEHIRGCVHVATHAAPCSSCSPIIAYFIACAYRLCICTYMHQYM